MSCHHLLNAVLYTQKHNSDVPWFFCLIIMIYCTVIKLCLVKMTVCTCSLLKSQVTGIIYFVIATLTICEIKYNLPPKSTRTVTVPSPPGL